MRSTLSCGLSRCAIKILRGHLIKEQHVTREYMTCMYWCVCYCMGCIRWVVLQQYSASALGNLAITESLRTEIVAAGAVAPLVALLTSGANDVKQ